MDETTNKIQSNSREISGGNINIHVFKDYPENITVAPAPTNGVISKNQNGDMEVKHNDEDEIVKPEADKKVKTDDVKKVKIDDGQIAENREHIDEPEKLEPANLKNIDKESELSNADAIDLTKPTASLQNLSEDGNFTRQRRRRRHGNGRRYALN